MSQAAVSQLPVYCQSHFAYLSLVLQLKCVDLTSPSLAQQPALSCFHTQPLPLASLSLLLQSQLILQALHLRWNIGLQHLLLQLPGLTQPAAALAAG